MDNSRDHRRALPTLTINLGTSRAPLLPLHVAKTISAGWGSAMSCSTKDLPPHLPSTPEICHPPRLLRHPLGDCPNAAHHVGCRGCRAQSTDPGQRARINDCGVRRRGARARPLRCRQREQRQRASPRVPRASAAPCGDAGAFPRAQPVPGVRRRQRPARRGSRTRPRAGTHTPISRATKRCKSTSFSRRRHRGGGKRAVRAGALRSTDGNLSRSKQSHRYRASPPRRYCR